MERIDQEQLNAMLMDPDVPDSRIRQYLQLDPDQSQGFRPVVVASPARVAGAPAVPEGAVALAGLNGVARWRRQQQYLRKIRGWTGPRVVAEGDSWFQYPFLITDVIDHLSDIWAIWCTSAAGDLLSDMARQDEVAVSVRTQKPDLLLLSGGGNDVLGGGQLQRYLLPHRDGAQAEDLVGPGFDPLLAAMIRIYADLIETCLTAGAKRVVLHSYDYAIPHGGQWLGRPMARLGIDDPALQRAILVILIDRFHAALTGMAGRFSGHVIVADCRRSVPVGEWYDELHPTSIGFGYPARIIRQAAESSRAEGRIEGAVPPVPTDRPLTVADKAAVERLLAADEQALVRELGRRDLLVQMAPDAAGGMDLNLPVGVTESPLSDLAGLGKRVLARLERELHELLCGDAPATQAERDKLRSALKLSDASLVGAVTTGLLALSCPAYVAPIAAAIIVKRGISPAWEETCRAWTERLAAEPAAAPSG